MRLDHEVCHRALRTRDPRFDGRFFVGVQSTGVYCRPVCPARTPKRENCRFFVCAAAAQDAGFRPCLRCRPETSPGTPAWLGSSATVSRAMRLIAGGALDRGGVEDLAARLGVGERQLRRLFDCHLGTSPVSVAQTRRILFAKKLIDETDLPMSEVAFSSGFTSIRRFNAAVRATYRLSPSQLRRPAKAARRASTGSQITVTLPYRPPFDWPALSVFLRDRSTAGVETVAAGSYRRTLCHDGMHGIVEVGPVPDKNCLRARVCLPTTAALIDVVERLRCLFDLGADPDKIAGHLSTDPLLRQKVRARPGLRLPGAWDGFELAVRAILGQQISVAAATTLAGRLAAEFGEPLSVDVDGDFREGLTHVFPSAHKLASVAVESIGVVSTRARAIRILAQQVAAGRMALDGGKDLESSITELCAIPGIGPWTAHYIAMRALREPDAFPAGDLALRRNLGDNGKVLTETQLHKIAQAWRPWRAYAVMHVWNGEISL